MRYRRQKYGKKPYPMVARHPLNSDGKWGYVFSGRLSMGFVVLSRIDRS